MAIGQSASVVCVVDAIPLWLPSAVCSALYKCVREVKVVNECTRVLCHELRPYANMAITAWTDDQFGHPVKQTDHLTHHSNNSLVHRDKLCRLGCVLHLRISPIAH